MKFRNGLNIVFAFALVLAMLLASGPSRVIASSIAEGAWSTGHEVEIDLKVTPAPYPWIQLLAKGVKISAPGEICHEFRGGRYNWVADVRRLVGDKWVRVPSTTGWKPSTEGTFMVCAQAPAAGTYALFGYYAGKPEVTGSSLPQCEDINVSAMVLNMGDGAPYTGIRIWDIAGTLEGETLTYQVLSYAKDPNVQGSVTFAPMSGSFTLEDDYFVAYPEYSGIVMEVIARISTGTCTFDVTFVWS
jgi:hypothetical protein